MHNFTLECYSNGTWELPDLWEKCYHPSGRHCVLDVIELEDY